MHTKLDYKAAEVPENCTLRISPSSFAKFISEPWNWYRNNILKLDVFQHSTASVLGTVVHYCAEQVGKNEDVDEVEIEKYIDSQEVIDGYDPKTVKASWYSMAVALVNEYVIPNREKFIGIEKEICAELGGGAYVAGTLDVLQGTKEDCMLVDYKSYNSKTKPKTIPLHYRYQLLTYAYALTTLGYNVTRIRLVYVNRHIDGGVSEKTNKPLKSYPSETTTLTETITDEDLAFIKSMLLLCKDTVDVSEKLPDIAHIIWHDPRIAEDV